MADSTRLEPSTLWRHARAQERWSVICDFDGTIATIDVTDELLARFAAPEWRALEQQWQDGAISARDCMAAQVRLLRAARADLYAQLTRVHLDPGFAGFVAECHSRALPLSIVSDGLDLAIRRVLAHHRLPRLPIYANRLLATDREHYRLEFPHARPGCSAGSGVCKCAVAQAQGANRVLLIGDGRSDFCLAARADFVFAKGRLAEHCEQRQIPHRRFLQFSQLHYLLSELLDHPHHHRRAAKAQPLYYRSL
ncbi:Haloacid Dehalogenase superfamily, subfamily IB, phosphoserine phosphatase-like/2,3-diketo-5-methylthio-1-phosphopentane phosphatase [Solimonas aquatica]|uniref:Haloacid Dehalogenase superfamily, subfamily IB, phosphoserine phosphatase-like/2,3-diketo-5-methylthio-1-phosphopentane phosphatase n=1 Tax=Solimonas aquatica TaxID=489703 RepID=A0A1H9EZR3_9GAMM|nr:MtnX-like HAD-IB family phosphatase [Solimonas aquatica]SEQ31131.1 Haloacid Dehalogenase superfamily, subfamily IB, phosphoserine phosphatase-like/2,3-diketo-5-methylthio-1-phosphopentane phosphatase [Solimonas aquatica]